MFVLFSLRQNVSTCYFADVVEYALSNFVDRLCSVDYPTIGKMQIVGHTLEDGRVRSEFYDRSNRISYSSSATCGEYNNSRARCYETGSRFLIITRPLHEIQPAIDRRFGIFDDSLDASRACFGDRS